MQWLIDIILALTGNQCSNVVEQYLLNNPRYVNRELFSIADFQKGDLTFDGAWHELDLSGIVPANAVAVNFHIVGRHTYGGRVFYVRQGGYTQIFGTCALRIQVANVIVSSRKVIGLSSTRTVDYNSVAPDWAQLDIKIKGWFF